MALIGSSSSLLKRFLKVSWPGFKKAIVPPSKGAPLFEMRPEIKNPTSLAEIGFSYIFVDVKGQMVENEP